MDDKVGRGACSTEDEMVDNLRRGPWTVEEDLILYNYIAKHGEGRWNSLARLAGLKRTGKSCRLRWLNYLRPDVKRGNITLEEQLIILELHSRWGNRWSKIAQYLPGRTDNEIKNYWRTRVQKHAKQLKCDVNSKQFKDTMRYLWMPRLVERIQASVPPTSGADTAHVVMPPPLAGNEFATDGVMTMNYTPENSSTAASSDSFGAQVSPASDQYYNIRVNDSPNPDYFHAGPTASSEVDLVDHGLDVQGMEQNNSCLNGLDMLDNLWNVEDCMFLQQFNNCL